MQHLSRSLVSVLNDRRRFENTLALAYPPLMTSGTPSSSWRSFSARSWRYTPPSHWRMLFDTTRSCGIQRTTIITTNTPLIETTTTPVILIVVKYNPKNFRIISSGLLCSLDTIPSCDFLPTATPDVCTPLSYLLHFEFDCLWRAKKPRPLWRRGRGRQRTITTPLFICFPVPLATSIKGRDDNEQALFFGQFSSVHDADDILAPCLPSYPSQVDRHVLPLPLPPLLHHPDRRL